MAMMLMMMMNMVTWLEELPEDCRKSQPRGRLGLRTPPVYQLGHGCHHYVGQCDIYDFVHSYQGLRGGIFTNFIVDRLVLSLALVLVLCLTPAVGDRLYLLAKKNIKAHLSSYSVLNSVLVSVRQTLG